MQILVPYPDIELSLSILDSRRLAKQRTEAKQLLELIRSNPLSWKHDPLARMWHGFEIALEQYLRIAIQEYSRKGGHNNIPPPRERPYKHILPGWFGDNRVHSSHRAALLAQDFNYYRRFAWDEEPCEDYWWP